MTNKKQDFIKYLEYKTPAGSNKPSSYAKAMEVVESALFTALFRESTSIWDFVNISNVNDLYNYIIEQQKKEDNIFKNYEQQSYWKKRFCSAALKEYREFLHLTDPADSVLQKPISDDSILPSQLFNISDFDSSLSNANFSLPQTLPYRFIASLITKPFVILTGLSGSGKTKLAEAFAMWIVEKDEQVCMISVGADWTNREPLLGFPNALEAGTYVKPDCGALDLILNAKGDPERPYFLILDEMNMSHVERYFADFLSAMESTDRIIALHDDSEQWKGDVPASIKLPENLFVIGTVNIDETTYMFSPKVLDRANVIEFRVSSKEMGSFLEKPARLDMSALKGGGKSMGQDFVRQSNSTNKKPDAGLKEDLMPFFNKLHETGAEFGYRSAVEIAQFVSVCEVIAGENMSRDTVIDAAIMQKLLPKVHGSRNKIEKTLIKLGHLCLNDSQKDPFKDDISPGDIKYKLAYEKTERMYSRVIADGFTSYAEA